MLGLIALIIFTVYAYKTARDCGRSSILWALITFGVGFVIQIVFPLLIGIVLSVVWITSGTDPDDVQSKLAGPALIIGIAGTILSLAAMALVLKFISRVPEGGEMPPTKRAGSLGLDG